uniref:Uncharacterized protein n=1 Tax=Arundo donax TaxID=35708 RepID=A0A0A8XV72_ARUDO
MLSLESQGSSAL